MGRHRVGAVGDKGRCSRSTLMARGLRICIVSRHFLVLIILTAMELIRKPHWFYPATPYMGRRLEAAVRAKARSSHSTRMARALRPSIVSRKYLIILIPTATEQIRSPD